MGPEDNGRKAVKLYMMADGQPVEIKTELAEITYAGDQQGNDNSILDNCEFSVRAKVPKSMRCKKRKRFVKLLMGRGVHRNTANAIAECVKWTRWSYQEYFWDVWLLYMVNGRPWERVNQ